MDDLRFRRHGREIGKLPYNNVIEGIGQTLAFMPQSHEDLEEFLRGRYSPIILDELPNSVVAQIVSDCYDEVMRASA